jgi:hypothetical protein
MIPNPIINKRWSTRILRQLAIVSVLIILLVQGYLALAVPEGANVTFNFTETRTPTSAASIATAGGTFTTLLLNGTTQTLRWKAYVGNATGTLTLDDAGGSTIYDWRLVSIAGEVYASRSNSIVWSSVNCSPRSLVENETLTMNMSFSSADNLNKTFNMSVHKQFFVGGNRIYNSTCPAIATYVNDSRQVSSESALFQEVLLSDGPHLVYSTLLEPGQIGFDRSRYNFQMIVPENEYAGAPTPYYFYLELS